MTGRTHRHRRHGERWSDRDTSMCKAYLVALGRWVLTHREDAVVVLPTGYATAEELVNVLRALEKSAAAN